MASVFISYSSKDRSEARRLARELTRRGIRAWIDEYEILPGDSIPDKISEGLRSSDFLLVLFSKNSTESKWVRYEYLSALSRDPKSSATTPIIPVKLDDSKPPEDLRNFRYVDISQNYDDGVREIVSFITKKEPPPSPNLTEIVNANGFAEQAKEQQRSFRGSGYLITTVLGLLTVIVTGATAIPSFYSAFGNRPQVYYSVSDKKIVIPSDIDADHIKKILTDNNIPEATIRVSVINMGDGEAKLVRAGTSIPGTIKFVRTEPPSKPNPVWVDINIEYDAKVSPSHAIFSFSRLIPNKPISALIGYQIQKEADPNIDVVYDGIPGIFVDDVRKVTQWSYWSIFKTPFKFFVSGLVLTVFVGLAVVIRGNPRLRDAFLLILKELNPTIAKLADILVKSTRIL